LLSRYRQYARQPTVRTGVQQSLNYVSIEICHDQVLFGIRYAAMWERNGFITCSAKRVMLAAVS
ncbi:hypothetical protein, partial [Streptomyces exfoliatus]|uniref:hypothetical protein n=1 Tax=Streptomyces exfoliatus TaxID=1905 RepID=UPI003C2BB60E